MTTSASFSIPPEISKAYYPGGISHEVLIEGGEINTTLLVVGNDDERSILQKLSPIYDSSMAEDYDTISNHLETRGWEMAKVRRAVSGTLYLKDPDDPQRLWRSYQYIESQSGSEFEGDWEASTALGGLLGKLHSDLSRLDYEPRFNLPHFHDAEHYSGQLQKIIPKMKDVTSTELADYLLSVSKEFTVAEAPAQLVHGDPRIGNVLFRNGKPFTFIDWDGMQIANPLLDVGDMLQSTVSELRLEGMSRFSITQLYPVIDAYYLENGQTTDKYEFREKAIGASRLVALVLGVRHLIDSVEDRYFTPPNQVESRYEFNMRRVNEQKRVLQVLS